MQNLFMRYYFSCLGFFLFLVTAFPQRITAQLLPKLKSKDTTKNKTDSNSAQIPAVAVISPDSTAYFLMNSLEDYMLMLNKDISVLRRGFDTSEISRELPLMETVLGNLKRNMDNKGERHNLRNLFSFQVALLQIEKQVAGHQEKLLGISGSLAEIRKDIRQVKYTSAFELDPDDSSIVTNYQQQMKPILAKKEIADSMYKVAQKKISAVQSRVTTAFLQCSEMLDDVNARIRSLQSQFFIRDQPYIWNIKHVPGEKSIGNLISEEYSRNRRVILFYYTLNIAPFIVILVLAAAFYGLIRFSYYKLNKSGVMGRDLPLHFFRRSMLGSTLLVLFTMTPFVLQNPPAGIVQMMWMLMLVTGTIMRWRDWNRTFRLYWICIIIFFLAYGADNFLLESSFTERIVLLFLNLLALPLSWLMYHEVKKDKKQYHSLMDESILLFMVINLLAFIMNISGRFVLSKVLSNSSALSIALLLALQIIKDILFEFIYLISESNKKSRCYSFFEYDRIKESFRGILNLATFVIWILAFAWSMNFSNIIFEESEKFLLKSRSLGQINFTWSSILIFLVLLWLSVMLGKIVTVLFRAGSSEHTATVKSRGSWILILRLIIYTTGFLIAIGAAGIPMDKFTIVIGALGVGIGFGLQTITNNLISGIILAFERPIEVGDIIDIGTKTGTVKEIGIRSSKITMFDGSDMIVPNGDLLSQHLVNWTHDNPNKRNELIIGVAYGTDLDKAKSLIESSLKDRNEMMTNPVPVILLNEFGNSAVNFRVLFWARDLNDAAKLRSDVMSAIYKNFSENGIEIPFPQTDLHIRSVDANAAVLLGDPRTDEGQGKTTPEKKSE